MKIIVKDLLQYVCKFFVTVVVEEVGVCIFSVKFLLHTEFEELKHMLKLVCGCYNSNKMAASCQKCEAICCLLNVPIICYISP
jgi:hypothetical protein